MNNLLPSIEEMKPIVERNQTFSDCVFNVDFNNLQFKEKLQVINDIVRQTILEESVPNPDDETNDLIGNCHTAALVSIKYLRRLGIGKNHKYVMARRRPYDPEDISTNHAMLLVDDERGNTYQFDATPYVGYKYGHVEDIKKERFYQDYDILSGEKLELLISMRKFIFKHKNKNLSSVELDYYKRVIDKGQKYNSLNGFSSQCYAILSTYSKSDIEKKKYIEKSLLLKPYDKKNSFKRLQKEKLVIRQINIWQDELKKLLARNENLKRQLELSQCIVQELKLIDSRYERYLNIRGNRIKFSHMNPRFFMEKDLNVVMIKPSAYHLGVRGTIRERFLCKGNGIIDEYFTNLSAPKQKTGIKPVLFSHSVGAEYERSLNGISNVMLLKADPIELKLMKKELRSNLGTNIVNREVIWMDGEKILWHPFVTNLVHTTDDSCEANMHYLIGYPEHQVMNRFMYPNPSLEKAKIKKKMQYV